MTNTRLIVLASMVRDRTGALPNRGLTWSGGLAALRSARCGILGNHVDRVDFFLPVVALAGNRLKRCTHLNYGTD